MTFFQFVHRFIATNTVRITALVQAVIATLLVFDVVTWSTTQIGVVEGLIAAIIALFVSGTVTANVRITDKMWGGYTGVGDDGEG